MPWHETFAQPGALSNLPTVGIQGRQHPTADGLIHRAHRGSTDRGWFIVGNRINLVQLPTPENNLTAIVIATVIMEDPQGNRYEFEGLGDANPQNCTSTNTAAAFPRMAETRAVSRALSIALNIQNAAAEELMEAGGVPQQPSAYQPQQQAGAYAPPAAPGAAPAAPQGNAPAWMYDMPGNKYPKGTKVYDPAVQVSDIQYWLDKGLFKKNPQTQQYDIPDHEKTAVFQAEIARRQGGAPVVPQAVAPQQPPVYQPPAGQPPVYNQAPPPPPAPGAPVAPQAPAYPTTPGAAPAGGPWQATPADMAELIKLGMASGVNLPAIKQMSQATFGNPEPLQLDKASFNTLRAQLGGQPLP